MNPTAHSANPSGRLRSWFRPLLVLALASALGAVSIGTADALETLYLVRHAEKEEPWPAKLSTYQPLTEEGRQRAQQWADYFQDLPIAAVYSSPYGRTVQTALPISRRLDVPLETAPASAEEDQIADFVEQLKTRHARNKAVLVVGHSNTLPYFLRHFGAEAACADALTLHTSGKYELIEGYEGLFVVDLGKTGCDALQRQTLDAEQTTSDSSLEARAVTLDAAHLVAASHRYRVVYGHESMGVSDLSLRPGDDQLEVHQSTRLGRAGIQQDITIRRSADGSEPRSIQIQGPMGPSSADVALTAKDGQLVGHSDFPRSRKKPQGKLTVDRPLPPGTFERQALLALLPAMAIDRISAFSLYAYDSRDDRLEPVEVRITGPLAPPERFGTEPLYRAELSGMDPGFVVWIQPQTPRHVVGIEWVGQPWVYELVPGKP